MDKYENICGGSGITKYEVGDGFIKVMYKDGHLYHYTNKSAGTINIRYMHSLAKQGMGLNSFIIDKVRKKYARKEF